MPTFIPPPLTPPRALARVCARLSFLCRPNCHTHAPKRLAGLGFPVAVCNQGEGGGELYNRSAGIKWADGGPADIVLQAAQNWMRPADAVIHMMHNGWGNVQYAVSTITPANRTIRFARGGWQH